MAFVVLLNGIANITKFNFKNHNNTVRQNILRDFRTIFYHFDFTLSLS